MTTRRRYAKKDKDSAVMAALASSTLAAADQTGIPESTIRYWLDDPKFAKLREKSDAERAEGFRTLASLAMARLEMLIPTMEPRDLVVLMGVATEKAALVSGGATARTESRSLTDGMDDHEKAKLKQVLAEAIKA